MPRSYSFDHFQSINAEKTAGVHDEEKQSVTQQHDVPDSATKIHYGKKFSQTEELFQAKQMNKQLEELAGLDRMPPKRAEEPKAQAREQQPQETPPKYQRGTPIGSLPDTEEPPPASFLRELYDEAGRHVRVVRVAARDIGRASLRLVTLPLEAAKLAARKIRHRHA
jgi:hypothetical protein